MAVVGSCEVLSWQSLTLASRAQYLLRLGLSGNSNFKLNTFQPCIVVKTLQHQLHKTQDFLTFLPVQKDLLNAVLRHEGKKPLPGFNKSCQTLPVPCYISSHNSINHQHNWTAITQVKIAHFSSIKTNKTGLVIIRT